MQTIKTSELTGAALDWAVAKCEGILEPVYGEPQPRVVFYSDQWQRYMRINPPPQVYYTDRYEPSTDWSQGGPIIEREKISTQELDGIWSAFFCDKLFEEDNSECWRDGPTPLIAAMRCYVASKLGDTVKVPDELAV